MKRKTLGILLVLVVSGMLLAACGGTAAPEPVEEPAPEQAPVEQAVHLPTYDVNTTIVQSGEGLTQAILRNCKEESSDEESTRQECFWSDFSGLAVFWQGTNDVFIEDLVAFNSLAVFNDLGGAQEGDIVVWGAKSEVMDYVRDNGFLEDQNTVRINSNMVTGENLVIEEVWFSGGLIIQPFYITHQRYPYEDFWRAYVNGVEMTPAEAYALATE